MPIRILIVDDHDVVRKGLRMFFNLEPEFEIVGEAADGKEAVSVAKQVRPDVVLMDLAMPEMDGIEATTQIRRELPDTEVVALTVGLQVGSVARSVRAGAIGYILKETRGDEVRRAVRAAAEGRVQLAPELTERLMRELQIPDIPEKLTEREVEILQLIAKGQSNKDIARTLVISEKTVKAHVSSILGKLNVSSRTQAALHAARVGLITGRP